MNLPAVLGAVTLAFATCAAANNQRYLFVPPVELLNRMTDEEIRELIRKEPPVPPLATSTYHLSVLAQDEARAAVKLRALVEAMFSAHEVLSRYLSSWEELVAAGVEAEGFASHPLHAYALTKHVSLGWPHVEAALQAVSNLSQDTEWLLSRSEKRGVPTGEDLATVAGGMARLHDYYSLNLTALAHPPRLSDRRPPGALRDHAFRLSL
ncbi:hypothetical protein C7M84_003154 [Penaeus vannamei]|uniref:Prolyl 4-hydroxylase N-terminal domain-containing protein n=1 Tax=Penaeus vannamei TaxID=6689 RepID=A0A3R7P836_PENVA|nr:hypothetical protein C7M84_003154 [Penaeus vannamei]